MPAVGVTFVLGSARTDLGESVFIVGNRPELGHWGLAPAASAVRLETDAQSYPQWLAPTAWIEPTDEERRRGELRVEYKYVVAGAPQPGGATLEGAKWESSIANRVVDLPAVEGGAWLVCDAEWDSAGPPPSLHSLSAAKGASPPRAAAAGAVASWPGSGPGECWERVVRQIKGDDDGSPYGATWSEDTESTQAPAEQTESTDAPPSSRCSREPSPDRTVCYSFVWRLMGRRPRPCIEP